MQEPKCFFCNESGGEMHQESSENMLENVQQSNVVLVGLVLKLKVLLVHHFLM